MKDNCSYLVSQSAVYEWVINVVRIENHLLHPVVAPALHELAELFEGDPIPGRDIVIYSDDTVIYSDDTVIYIVIYSDI